MVDEEWADRGQEPEAMDDCNETVGFGHNKTAARMNS